MNTLAAIINQAWESRTSIAPGIKGQFADAIYESIQLLDRGEQRVAEKKGQTWQVNDWLKKAVLLSFRLFPNILSSQPMVCYDKVPLKFDNWDKKDFEQARIRVVPGAVVRMGSYLGNDTVVMPSFVNIGSFVDSGTMIDSYATIGSCAQVGKNCHISANVLIGGVLEPLQASPVIIEDNCFIGARCDIVEGVIIEEGAVIGMGVALGQSTPIVDRESGQVTYGRVPSYSVVVPGNLPSKDGKIGPGLNCAVIVKRVTAETKAKTSLNELLRAS
jgi:2,3,4,5-tetrahydropyridine-2-carboxylate N-succinyltransferase